MIHYKNEPMNELSLSIFLNCVNRLIDNGYKDSVDDICKNIEEDNLSNYLYMKYPKEFDTMKSISDIKFEAINKLLKELNNTNSNADNRDSYFVQNNGLCLLIAWTSEMMSDWKSYEHILKS